MDISPTLRKIQQSYTVQTFLIPAAWLGAGAMLASWLVSAKGNLFNLNAESLQLGLGIGGFAAIAYIAGIIQKGLGATDVTKAGTPVPGAQELKKIADANIALQKAAVDPSVPNVGSETANAASAIINDTVKTIQERADAISDRLVQKGVSI